MFRSSPCDRVDESGMFNLHAKHHRDHLHLFPTLKGVIGMLRNPEHTESVFDIEDGLRDLRAYQLAEEYAKSDPEVASIVRERYLMDPPDMDRLGQLDEVSLGKAFWRHIEDHGFDPDYYRKIDVHTDLDYILMRVRQTHDLWHVMNGIGPSRLGEIAIKSFELAQLRRPMAGVIAAGAVIRYMMEDPDQLGDVLEVISYAYRKGRACSPLLAEKFELHWERPLEEWRAAVGLDIGDMPAVLQRGDR